MAIKGFRGWHWAVAAMLFTAGSLAHGDAVPLSPQLQLKDLFTAVQAQQVFPDGKLFVDATPKEPPAAILSSYHHHPPTSTAALKEFVMAHFVLPLPAETLPSPPTQVALREHIDLLWPVLTRSTPTAPAYSSLLSLPQPYVVPGGRFREMYYWDSYFTMLGLARSGRSDLLQSMVTDFAYLIDTYGHIPNGARTYYLSRSQPPFFFAMVGLLPNEGGAAFGRYLTELKREHAFWMDGEQKLRAGQVHRRIVAMPDGAVLNRYWDDSDLPRDESYREDTELARESGRPAAQVYRDIRAAAESGWDFGSRWFADGSARASIVTTDIVPVDLNSLLYGLETAIAKGCMQQHDEACHGQFEARAKQRLDAMNKFLWDGSGAYYDFRLSEKRRIPRISAATLYPLFVGASSKAQGGLVAARVRSDLLQPGGIVTTPRSTGQQWDSPNGWAPLQWIAVSGLRDAREMKLAALIACRWLANVNDVYRQSGKLVEKYDVVTPGRSGGGGEYPSQDGFGWTNGVVIQLMDLYPEAMQVAHPAECREH
jgi:alpha,alpha-trehalase